MVGWFGLGSVLLCESNPPKPNIDRWKHVMHVRRAGPIANRNTFWYSEIQLVGDIILLWIERIRLTYQ